jgi:hypothetical protein
MLLGFNDRALSLIKGLKDNDCSALNAVSTAECLWDDPHDYMSTRPGRFTRQSDYLIKKKAA